MEEDMSILLEQKKHRKTNVVTGPALETCSQWLFLVPIKGGIGSI